MNRRSILFYLLCLLVTATAAEAAQPQQKAPPARVAASASGPPVVVTVNALGRGDAPAATASGVIPKPPQGESVLLTRLRASWTPEGQEPPVTYATLSCAVMDEEAAITAEAAEGSLPGVVLVGIRAASVKDEVAEERPEASATAETVVTAPAAETVRLEMRLPQGLWRVDAALEKDGQAPRRWRMQSIWQKSPGIAVKTVKVPPGETLTLRFTETIAAAARAHKATRGYQGVGGRTYGGASVKTTLARVGDALNGMPALIAGGKRDPLVKKAHVALLAAAQAHAMCQNARQASLTESEPAFDTLLESLSEISCAAHGLVPQQSVVTDASGKETVQITLTNTGVKTIPLVAIGLAPDHSAGSLPTQQMIFYKLKPGKQVAARFPGSAITAGEAEIRGAVQFNVGMGTAVVLACPVP